MADLEVLVRVRHFIIGRCARVISTVAKLAEIAEEIRGVLLVNLKEHVLEVRHRDSIRPDVELVKSGIQVIEESAEVVRL